MLNFDKRTPSVQAAGIGAQDQARQFGGAAGGGVVHDVLAMYMNGVFADRQFPCHFLVGEAVDEKDWKRAFSI